MQTDKEWQRPRPSGGNGAAGRLRRWLIPIIGALTPVGLIVVNIAAFIVDHLSAFRVAITILAFVSGLMLNSWTAFNIYRGVQRARPDHPALQETNVDIAIVVGMGIVIISAAATAWFCYRGLANASDLPNALTFVTGAVAIAIPIALKVIFSSNGDGDPRARRRFRNRSLDDPGTRVR